MKSMESTIGMSEAERMLFRLRALHRDRVEAIQIDKAAAPHSDPSRLVVHIMPQQPPDVSKEFSAVDLKKAARHIRHLGARNEDHGSSRFNADGVLLSGGKSYSQLFRTGAYEGVMGAVVYQKEQAKILREHWCEDAMLGALSGYLTFSKTLGLQPPFWMFAAIVGCEGARICLNPSWGDLSENAIDRSVVWLPHLRMDVCDVDANEVLRPIFDVLWNSAGLERSFSFDEHGNRRERR